MSPRKTKIPPSDDVTEPNVESHAALNAKDTKSVLANRLLKRIREELAVLEQLLTSEAEPADIERLLSREQTPEGEFVSAMNQARIVEGIFDGQNMVGADGRHYLIPPNYASKSKLVEGDLLKLTIQSDGSFLFKQIGPIERERILGALIRDEHTQEFKVVAEGKKYHVLQASISYYKGETGDDVVILVPKSAPSQWAAVENLIKKE